MPDLGKIVKKIIYWQTIHQAMDNQAREIVELDIDAFGRIVIPKSWRKTLGNRIVMHKTNEKIRNMRELFSH